MFYSRSCPALRPGVNVYGYFFAEHGVGEESRALVEIVSQAGIEYSAIPYTETYSRQGVGFTSFGCGESIFDINLICINANTVEDFVRHVGPQALEGRYNIGMWAWEVEDLPTEMARSAGHLDEIWSCSQYSADAISRSVDCPVHVLPLPVHAPDDSTLKARDAGLSDSFLFLSCFDFNSIFERKNSLGLVSAFLDGFEPSDGALLLIKTINGKDFPLQLQRLYGATLDHDHVHVVDGYLNSQEQAQLMASCDAYVSLHRSEGFGFTLAEAMALGKPVIGTGYSGNMDFMTEDNSYPVPYTRVAVGDGCAPYPPDSHWADPDLPAAARILRRVFERPSEARAKGERARNEMTTRHSAARRTQFVLERLQDIRATTDPVPERAGPYVVLGFGEPPAGQDVEVRSQMAESRERHTDRVFREFSSASQLLASQRVDIKADELLPDTACGTLDQALELEGGIGLFGWAYDPRTMTPACAVFVQINDRLLPMQVAVEQERQDVADHMNNPDLASVGWSLLVGPHLQRSGRNHFEAFALLSDGRFGRIPAPGGGGLEIVVSPQTSG